MSKSAKIGERIKVLKEKLGVKSDRELEMGGLPGGKWLLSNGLLSKWDDVSVEKATDKIELFLSHYNINRHWWKTGEGEVFNEKHTHDQNEPPVEENSDRGVFETVVRANSTDYVVLPKTTLDGEYRIMPKKELEKYERQFDKIDERTQLTLNAKDEVIRMKEELLRDRDAKLKEREELILSLQKRLGDLSQKTD